MKSVLLIAVSLLFAASAFAQGTAPANVKFINTEAFRVKDGITKYVNAVAALEKEFEAPRIEIRNLLTRHDTLAKEVQALQDQIDKAPIAAKESLEKQLNAKVDEGRNLELQIKRKQEDGKNRFERREADVMNPIRQDIGNAMITFANQKGYAVIFDISKLTGAILVYDAAKADVTKDFIAYYNARPATATR